MDCKTKNRLFLFLLVVLFCGCTDKSESNNRNTYYVEFLNCSDSLHTLIEAKINGKVSFYKNNELKVLSLNYATEKYPDMHYFNSIKEISAVIPEGSLKIKVDFSGNQTNDSTYYSIQRFQYSKKDWIKISDLGTIKAISNVRRAKKEEGFNYMDLTGQVIQNLVSSTY